MSTASPRHPWKALAVVLLVFAVVHGARAHADLRDHALMHVHVVHAGHDCDRDGEPPRIDMDDEGADDDEILDTFDDDRWS